MNFLLSDRVRQKIAQWLFRRTWDLKKLAAWIFPDSSVTTLAMRFDGLKIRFMYYRPHISDFSDDIGMREADWHRTVISLNNEIDRFKKNPE